MLSEHRRKGLDRVGKRGERKREEDCKLRSISTAEKVMSGWRKNKDQEVRKESWPGVAQWLSAGKPKGC